MSRPVTPKRAMYKYSEEKMASAIAMAKSGQMSRRLAASTYKVPLSTLCDKLNGRTPEGRVRPGQPTVLTPSEESVLVDYCKLMATIGYPVTRQNLLQEVKRVLDVDGRKTPIKQNLPGKDWWYSFKARHPDISE